MKAILACDRNGGIGYNGGLPWPKNSDDLRRFKNITDGKTVVMGRKTWESTDMPKPLPNRKNVVITTSHIDVSQGDADDVMVYSSFDASNFDDDAFIIGGAKLVDSVFDNISKIYLSRFHYAYECDSYIDLGKITSLFECTYRRGHMNHTFEIWDRK